MDKQENNPKNVVKEIFEKRKLAADKISAIFTYFKEPSKKSLLKSKISLPSFLKELPAAIDIGTSGVKIVQLAQGALEGSLEIVSIDRESYSTTQELTPHDRQKEALKKIIERNSITHEVMTNLAAKDVQIYNLSFPQMPEKELSEAIRWKIAQLKPFDLGIEAIEYGFIKLEALPGLTATQQKVLVACASKKLVQSKVSLLQEMGLKVVGMEVEPISLVNLDKFRKSVSAAGKDEIVLWLDLGSQESSLVVSRGDTLYFCRALAHHSQDLTKQIMQHCRIFEEVKAENLKREYGLSFWSPDKKTSVFLEPGQSNEKPEDKASMVYYSLVSSMENLIIDIQHSFKYFSYQVTQSQITKFDRVILAGGGASLKNIDNFLSTKLGVPVEKLNPFSYFKLADSEANRKKKDELVESATKFAACTGLAAARKIEDSKRINLLSKESAKGLDFLKEHLHDKPVKVAVIALSFVVLLSALQIAKMGLYRWSMNRTNGMVKHAQSELGNLQAHQLKLAKQEGALLEQKTKFESRLNLLKGAIRMPDKLSEVFAEVAALLPEEIWIRKITYLDRKFNIIGAASGTALVIELIEKLKLSDNFSDATFNYTQKEVGTNTDVYNFEIIAYIK